jgi:OOP family OmpA-OmpF porin
MKKLNRIAILLIISQFICAKAAAQKNLVPNSSFENIITCPTWSGIDEFVEGWTNPNRYSPDYFNACANMNTPHLGVPTNGYGNQNARAGVAYVGIYIPVTSGNSLREYIQAELTEPLVAGEKYSVRFYVSLAENFSNYSVNTLGAYLSVSAASSTTNTVFNIEPQIVNNPTINPLTNKVNWQEVSGIYTAVGGEKFITIGNFESDGNVDTTSLVPIPSISDAAYYYVDDVSIESTTTNINEASMYNVIINSFPNPASDILNIELTNFEYYDIKIISAMGDTVIDIKNVKRLHSINVRNNPNGIYFLQITQRNTLLTTKKIIINH